MEFVLQVLVQLVFVRLAVEPQLAQALALFLMVRLLGQLVPIVVLEHLCHLCFLDREQLLDLVLAPLLELGLELVLQLALVLELELHVCWLVLFVLLDLALQHRL